MVGCDDWLVGITWKRSDKQIEKNVNVFRLKTVGEGQSLVWNVVRGFVGDLQSPLGRNSG